MCVHYFIFNLFFVRALNGERRMREQCIHSTYRADIWQSIQKGISKRMVAFKIYSAKIHKAQISSKNLCHFSVCLYIFMPNIFHLFFHSLFIRLRCTDGEHAAEHKFSRAHASSELATQPHSWYIFACNR